MGTACAVTAMILAIRKAWVVLIRKLFMLTLRVIFGLGFTARASTASIPVQINSFITGSGPVIQTVLVATLSAWSLWMVMECFGLVRTMALMFWIHRKVSSGISGTIRTDPHPSIIILCAAFVSIGKALYGWAPASHGMKMSKEGLNRFDPATQTFAHFLKDQKVRAIFEDGKGKLWAGTTENKLYSVDKISGSASLHPVMPRPGSPIDHITFIREDGVGLLWIGTFESGIVRYDPTTGTSYHYGDGQGLTDNSGWQACASREGVLWFSTQSANLYRIDPAKKPYHFYPSESGVLGFAESAKDHIWLSTNGGLIYQQPKVKPTHLGIKPGSARNTVPITPSQFLLHSADSQLLVQNGVLYRLDEDKHVLKEILNDSDYIRHALALDRTHLLIATLSGLYKLNLLTLKKDKIPAAGSDINALYIDHQKMLWAGHVNSNGLTRTDASGQVTTWLKGNTISCLDEDSKANLWVGTPNGAFIKYAGQQVFTPLRVKGSPIGSAAIIGFAEDDSGYIWISSRSGIFQLNPENNQVRQYGINHGVNSSVLTGAIFRKQSGNILVGSEGGFYEFDPRSIAMKSSAPQIIMRELMVAGQLLIPIDSMSSVTLKHDQDIFSIGFAGIHFSNPGENIHLYKLEGYDPDWRKAGAERTAYYFNVPHGKYVFRVKVGNNEDVWAEKSLSIEILPAWWTNTYFIIFAVGFVMLLIYAGVRWRFRMQLHRQLEKSRIDQQLAELQHRSSELEMQALRAQMNPHFIFNALNAINRFHSAG